MANGPGYVSGLVFFHDKCFWKVGQDWLKELFSKFWQIFDT